MGDTRDDPATRDGATEMWAMKVSLRARRGLEGLVARAIELLERVAAHLGGEGRGVDRAEPPDRDGPGHPRGPSRGHEPAEDDLPFGAWPYGEVVIRGDAAGPRPVGEELVSDWFRQGRLLLRRSVDHARPEGEGLHWDLYVYPGDRRDHIWGGEGHDLKGIRGDIVANREEITARMDEIAREKGRRPERPREVGREP